MAWRPLAPVTLSRARRRRLAAGIVGTAALLVLAGCHYTGIGQVRSATGHGTAFFHFDLRCDPGTNVQSGVLQYIDSGAGVDIKGTASGSVSSCGTNSYGEGIFTGTYVTVARSPARGTFRLVVNPGRAPTSGSTSGASFSLQLAGGPLAGYHDSGPILDGTIVPVGGPNA